MIDTIEKKLKSNKGITLITLVTTIVIMFILLGVTVRSTYIGMDVRKYQTMRADVKLLEDKILYFYREYGELPTGERVYDIPEEIQNGHDFYEINTNKMENITLNYASEEDVYIVDAETFEVYYLKGIQYKNTIYYTD